MARSSPWSRFVESAVHGQERTEASAARAVPGRSSDPVDVTRKRPASQHATLQAPRLQAAAGWKAVGLQTSGLRERVGRKLRGQERGTDPTDTPRRRTDVRLALPALLVWLAAVAGVWLTPAALLALCCLLLLLASLLVTRTARSRGSVSRRRSFLMTTAVALVLAATAAAHSAVAASQRHDGPFAEAVAAGKSVVAILEVSGSPRAMSLPGVAGTPERWSVAVRTEAVTVGGHVIRTRAQLVVLGGKGWDGVVPGQVVRAAGKLKPPDAGKQETGILTASLAPATGPQAGPHADPGAGGAPSGQAVAKDLRSRYVSAASFLAADPAGLLPGMVTGDTSALDEGLEAAMKAVGMTHLTAVSGANCSLVLGALLLAARSLRLPRFPAAGLALAGLGMFVVLVGPDASVLRAALMGSIAVAALAGGRMGRGLSYLCLAVMGLLLIDPGLATSFGFLLSVLATLGIIVLGRRMIDWTPAVVPRWAAAAWSVPLSAQLLCGPVIVLLQPQFSTYSLLANLLAAPLVAPVTLLGTAAVPLVVAVPWLATALIAVAGTFSAGVAGTARFTAGLPGASLPWPEGPFGMLTMLLLSMLTLAVVWLAVRPRQLLRLILTLHGRTELLLGFAERHVYAAIFAFRRAARRHGLAAGARRGRLRHCTRISGRNPPWPQPSPHEPGLRRRTQPPGGT